MTIRAPGGKRDAPAFAALWTRMLASPAAWLVPAAILVQGVAVVAMLRFDPRIVVAAVLLAVLAPLALGSISRILALFVFFLMVVPRTARFGAAFTYHDAMAVPFIGLAALILVRDRLDRRDLHWHPNALSGIWFLLIAWTAFQIGQGLLRDVDRNAFTYELVQLGLYLTFFLALDGFRRPADFRILLAALFAGISIVFLEYAFAAAAQSSIASTGGRVLSRQANLTASVAPFLVALALTGGARSWLWLTGMVPLGIIALLAQQRSLLVALVVSVIVASVFAVRSASTSRRRVLGLSTAVALSATVAWNVIGSISTVRGGASVTESVIERATEVATVDESPAAVLVRLGSYAHIVREKIAQRPLIGWGIGDVAAISILRAESFTMMRVDNAFLTLAWKSGLIGLALVLLLWGAVLRRAWQLARNPSRDARVIAIGVAGSLAAMLVISLAGAVITHYRFNAIWGVMMAAVVAAGRVYAETPSLASSRSVRTR